MIEISHLQWWVWFVIAVALWAFGFVIWLLATSFDEIEKVVGFGILAIDALTGVVCWTVGTVLLAKVVMRW